MNLNGVYLRLVTFGVIGTNTVGSVTLAAVCCGSLVVVEEGFMEVGMTDSSRRLVGEDLMVVLLDVGTAGEVVVTPVVVVEGNVTLVDTVGILVDILVVEEVLPVVGFVLVDGTVGEDVVLVVVEYLVVVFGAAMVVGGGVFLMVVLVAAGVVGNVVLIPTNKGHYIYISVF